MKGVFASILSIVIFSSPALAQGGDGGSLVGNVESGALGSPLAGPDGKVFVADSSNSRLAVVTAATNAATFVALPGQPETMGGALSLSKDQTLLAVPLKSGSIAVLNTSTLQVAGNYSTGAKVPMSTAFAASNTLIFFSTTENFDDVYLLDTAQGQVVTQFPIGPSFNDQGTDLQLATNDAGTALYVLERFGSPGGLSKIDVSDPLNPVFVARDDHGDLGSNCRGLALIPGGIAPPVQGHEAYIACGYPYYVQAISRSGARLFPTTQFTTAHYPIGVDTLPNGDVIGVRDTNDGLGAFHFDSGGTFKAGWGVARGVYDSITSDGVAGILVDGAAKVYITVCGISPTTPTNCFLQSMGGPIGGDGDDDDDADPSAAVSLNKAKFPSGGGKLQIAGTVTGGEAISNVRGLIRSGAKLLTVSLQRDPGSGKYYGSKTLPKNKSKKNVIWSVTVEAIVDGGTVTSPAKAVTVKRR